MYVAMAGLGDVVTMSPDTAAQLKACSDGCTAKFGMDLIGLASCYATCDVAYPPTISATAPPGTTPVATLPSLPALPSLFPSTPAAPVPVVPVPLAPAPVSNTNKYLLIGGALALAGAVGYVVYKKSKKAA